MPAWASERANEPEGQGRESRRNDPLPLSPRITVATSKPSLKGDSSSTPTARRTGPL